MLFFFFKHSLTPWYYSKNGPGSFYIFNVPVLELAIFLLLLGKSRSEYEVHSFLHRRIVSKFSQMTRQTNICMYDNQVNR